MTIQSEISTANLELVRDRIGEILVNELAAQATLQGNTELNIPVWVERFIPFDKEELPAINISVLNGSYSDETAETASGEIVYAIDVFSKSKSESNGGIVTHGDIRSMKFLHQVAGLCRSILMNSLYITLGFARGFIARRRITSFAISDPGNQDGSYVSMWRFDMSVKMTEKTIPQQPTDASGYDSMFTINETEKGFKFTINN